MKNEGTAQVHEGTARRYCSKVLLLFESTAHYAQSTARCESTLYVRRFTYSSMSRGISTMTKTQVWDGEISLLQEFVILVFFQYSDHYIEPTEFEIQEMVNILVSGEAYCLIV
ncbi:hypothetical protein Tco_1466438 [Tanacetum coccineum]